MASIPVPDGEGTERERLFGLRPQMEAAMAQLTAAVYDGSILPLRTFEAVRMRIAEVNACPT
jgi:alkylhydroperoxidase family enzyme